MAQWRKSAYMHIKIEMYSFLYSKWNSQTKSHILAFNSYFVIQSRQISWKMQSKGDISEKQGRSLFNYALNLETCTVEWIQKHYYSSK